MAAGGGHGRRPRSAPVARTVGTVAALWAGAVIALAAPAGAHESSPSVLGRPWTQAALSVSLGAVLVVATVALAGLLVAAMVVGPSPRPHRARRAEEWLAVAAGACDVVVLAGVGPVGGVAGGWPRWLAWAHLGLVAAVFVGANRWRWASAAVAGGLWLSVGAAEHASRLGDGELLDVAVGVAHIGAATVWVGMVVHLALGWGRDAESRDWVAGAIGRAWPLAAAAAGATAVTGVANMGVHGAWSRDLPGSAYGRVLIAKAGLLAPAALGLGAVVRRWAQPARRRFGALARPLVAEAGVFAVVLVLASTLPGLISPAAATDPGTGMLRRLRLGDRTLTVSVSPQRPGDNVVAVMGPTAEGAFVRVGDRDVALGPARNGARSAVVSLPWGRSTLRVSDGGEDTSVAVDTRPARRGGVTVTDALPLDGPYRAECASRHLGRLVALAQADAEGSERYRLHTSLWRVGDPPAPVDLAACGYVLPSSPPGTAVEPSPARAGGAFVRFLVGHGVDRVLLVAGSSRRGRELADGAAAVAGQAGVTVETLQSLDAVDQSLTGRAPSEAPDAVVVATDWDDAQPALDRLADSAVSFSRGIYLAPWLFDPALLKPDLGPQAVQVSVGLSLSPASAPALAYLAALRRFAPGAEPTGTGMAGYVEALLAVDQAPDGLTASVALAASRMEIFTPIRVGVLPSSVSAGHAGAAGPRWLAGATLAEIGSVPLADP